MAEAGPRNTPTLAVRAVGHEPEQCRHRLGAIDPGAGTVSFLIDGHMQQGRAAVCGKGDRRDRRFGRRLLRRNDRNHGSQLGQHDRWHALASLAGLTAPTPPLYNLSVNFDVERNDTGSLRTGRLVWKDGGTVVGERQSCSKPRQQPNAACRAVRSFSARAVDPRHNRITWSLPEPSPPAVRTLGLSLTWRLRAASTAVQMLVGRSDEYIHGALPSCPADRAAAH